MKLPNVISCGVYREAQKGVQRMDVQWISLTISGLKRCKVYYPDGLLAGSSLPEPPFLSLGFPGFRCDFDYGADRENWVLMFSLPEFRYDPQRHQLYLREGENEIPLCRCTVPSADVYELRNMFSSISGLSKSALPADHLRADFAAASLLRHFLPEESPSASPAAQLRKRLDADREHRYSLKEHCRILGWNPDYLRRTFLAEFGVLPGVYRERRQKNDLLSLFTYSTLSFKEIADKLGLKHVQHLNLLTERYFHCTPGELNRRYRKTLPYIEANAIR